MQGTKIIGIETSCDETSVAIVENGRIILSNIVSSQIDIHKKYGGVVPEIASRKHIESINPIIQETLEQSNMRFQDLQGIAVTNGPGLVGALLVGLSLAKGMAFALDLPLIGVNHIEGHICANYLQDKELTPPFICLVVSGGHSHLVYVKDFCDYEIMGRTRDDAAGEVFDKIARSMGLGYPGGPLIDLAAMDGNCDAISFPRSYLEEGSYDFSFSGLKSSVINYINSRRQKGDGFSINDVAASFQKAVIDVLIHKTISAADMKKTNRIVLAGGVASNRMLRKSFKIAAVDKGLNVYYPSKELCTDNAAMIASAGYYRLKIGQKSSLYLNAIPNLKLC